LVLLIRLRIEQYFQVQDYALWDVIENGNSFKPVAQTTTNTDGTSTSLIPGPITTEEKTQKNNDVKTIRFKRFTNEVNTAYRVSTANTQVSPASTQVSTASTQVSTANLSDDIVYAFFATLLSMRTRRFFQKTSRKITINGSDTTGYDKFKVECFNCHKMRYFARECRGPRNQDNMNRNQDSSRRTVNVEETSSKAMVTIDGAGFDWSYMADEEVPTNIALMAFLDSEPKFEGYGPKTSKSVSEDISNEVKESPDAPLVKESQSPRGKQRNWNNQKSQQLGSDFVMYNKACFVCESFNHVQANCNYHQRERVVSENNYTRVNYNYFAKKAHPSAHRNMVPKAVLMKTQTSQPSPIPQTSRNLMEDWLPLGESKGGKITGKGTLKLGKQYKASCKSKIQNSITQPLFMLHMDLFGPTFVSSLMNKKYYVVVTNDYSRFTWVFFLASKDETSGILKIFITEIENLVDKKVKIIICDNGTEFKNRVMSEFWEKKGIKREFSIARTPQQNGVAERRNRTLIEAARTMLTDSKLPTKFWAEAVNTSCYVLNRSGVQTIRMTKSYNEQGFISAVYEGKTHEDLHTYLFACFLSQEEPKRIAKAQAIQTWDILKKKDDEVFALIARIEAIRLFLAYASFMGFMVYQMDVKSAFLYGRIKEEVYVCQPLGFEDPDYPDKVYKVVKALYGLHQALRAWYETLAKYLLDNGFHKGKIDQTLFIKKQKGDILLVQVYVDDIIFGSTKKELCTEFEKLMHDKFQMSSMGELTFFLGLQVKSMIGSLMYLTSSRPDIMFAVCACARFQVTPKVSHLHVVKRIFRYLKGQPKLGLWYPRDSSFDLVAYSDSDYAGASLDRKSTTGGCQFLGCRLISWQCKKQTVVATSSTKAEYVAAASCCGQVLWIQNQMLDYRISKAVWLDLVIPIMEFVREKFWQTATARTLDNGEIELTATIDGKVKIVTKTSVRRHLQLADFDYSDSKHKFLMYPRFIQVFSNKHKRLLQPHARLYIAPTHTQKLFSNMKRVSKGYTGENIPLFPAMIVQGLVVQGEGLTHPAESHHIPTSAPTTSQLLISPTFKRTTRQESVVPQPRSPTQTPVADKAAFTGVDV
ncbi:putative ribonuclease H-like domain-containing protein, partial [Tanacetum coccineum]